jgi:hypothetical protein
VTDHETRDDALLVSVADDVDRVPVWGAHADSRMRWRGRRDWSILIVRGSARPAGLGIEVVENLCRQTTSLLLRADS